MTDTPRSIGKIVVALQLGTHSQWPEFATLLGGLDFPFALYVHVTDLVAYDNVKDRIITDFPDARITTARDKGMDIGPFLLQLLAIYGSGVRYDTLLKLHTKSIDYLRRRLVDPLIGDSKRARSALAQFDDPAVGMVGGAECKYLFQPKTWPGRPAYEKALRLCEMDSCTKAFDDYPFVGGTMFYARWSIFEKWMRGSDPEERIPMHLYFAREEMEVGNPSHDFRLPHAVERLFGLLVHAAGQRITFV